MSREVRLGADYFDDLGFRYVPLEVDRQAVVVLFYPGAHRVTLPRAVFDARTREADQFPEPYDERD